MDEDDDDIIREIRVRSRRAVFQVFIALTFVALGVGLATHHAPETFLVQPQEAPAIARGFLFMAAAYTATLFAWDWVFGVE
jgi:fatty acid desaturase